MSGQITLRTATRDDVPVLTALIVESARNLSRGFYSPEETESAIRYVFGVDTLLIDDQTYFVAELDGSLAGCGGWSRRDTLYGGDQRPVGTASLLDPARDPARIRAFFVSPSAARRGVGRTILAACTRAALSAGFHSLTLMATLPGVPFYEALGFTAAEDVVDTLPDGTALRFVKMSMDIK
jgi:N-acetylglutamate synthase-like GNAT family acetyltransferase